MIPVLLKRISRGGLLSFTVFFIEYLVKLLHPRVVFPRYSIFISFQFGCFCQTILNVEFKGVEDPLTTENHVLMRTVARGSIGISARTHTHTSC